MIWTLIYDLFSVTEAPDVSGVLSFCWGVATLIVPVFETLILGAAAENVDSTRTLVNETVYSTTNKTVFSTTMTTVSSDPLLNTPLQRSFGNQMVMAMLCGFLTCASITQFVMYFLVIRNSTPKEERKNDKLDAAHANQGFQ